MIWLLICLACVILSFYLGQQSTPVTLTWRPFPIGFPVTTVEPGMTVVIKTSPGAIFRPHKIVIPSTVDERLLITDFSIGQQSCFYGPGALPVRAFSETANPFEVSLFQRAILPGEPIQLEVYLPEDAGRSVQVCGAIFGESLMPSPREKLFKRIRKALSRLACITLCVFGEWLGDWARRVRRYQHTTALEARIAMLEAENALLRDASPYRSPDHQGTPREDGNG